MTKGPQVSPEPGKRHGAIGEALRALVASQAEHVSDRASASAQLGAKDYGHAVGVKVSVIGLITIDRGHREVPVQPDYVGRIMPTKHRERVEVDTNVLTVDVVE